METLAYTRQSLERLHDGAAGVLLRCRAGSLATDDSGQGLLVTRTTRLLWAVAAGVAIGAAAIALSRWVSPAAGWALVGLVLVAALVRARRNAR